LQIIFFNLVYSVYLQKFEIRDGFQIREDESGEGVYTGFLNLQNKFTLDLLFSKLFRHNVMVDSFYFLLIVPTSLRSREANIPAGTDLCAWFSWQWKNNRSVWVPNLPR